MDGKPDDLFLPIGDAYRDYRLAHPDLGTWIHCGDTYDMARARYQDIFKRWHELDQMEEDDIFLVGNHEVSVADLQMIAPGKCLESIEINGYLIQHGHQYFDWTDTPQENLFVNHLLWLHRVTNRRWAWLEAYIESILQTHRDNEKVYAKLEAFGIKKAIFGHTHYQGQQGDYLTPGALAKTGTVVVFDTADSEPRFERIL